MAHADLVYGKFNDQKSEEVNSFVGSIFEMGTSGRIRYQEKKKNRLLFGMWIEMMIPRSRRQPEIGKHVYLPRLTLSVNWLPASEG